MLTGVMIAWVLVVMVGNDRAVAAGRRLAAGDPVEGLRLPYWAGLWFGVFPTWEGLSPRRPRSCSCSAATCSPSACAGAAGGRSWPARAAQPRSGRRPPRVHQPEFDVQRRLTYRCRSCEAAAGREPRKTGIGDAPRRGCPRREASSLPRPRMRRVRPLTRLQLGGASLVRRSPFLSALRCRSRRRRRDGCRPAGAAIGPPWCGTP